MLRKARVASERFIDRTGQRLGGLRREDSSLAAACEYLCVLKR